MSGYCGYNMSNNAVEAYHCGERPKSKWNKGDIIDTINTAIFNGEIKTNGDRAEFVKMLRKVPAKVLKERCLCRSSWHHTSCWYNSTDFYSVDFIAVEALTPEELEKMTVTVKAAEPKVTEETWECEFLEWSGTRRHPKATKCVEVGVIRGNWFYRKDGSKKSVNARGFRKIGKFEI